MGTQPTRKVRIVCIDTSATLVGPQSYDGKIHDFSGDLTSMHDVLAFVRDVADPRHIIDFIPGFPSGYEAGLDRVNLFVQPDSFNSHVSCIWLEPVKGCARDNRRDGWPWTHRKKAPVDPFATFVAQNFINKLFNHMEVAAAIALLSHGRSEAMRIAMADLEVMNGPGYEEVVKRGNEIATYWSEIDM